MTHRGPVAQTDRIYASSVNCRLAGFVAVLALALAAAGPAASKPIPGFTSPTGNIKCLFVPATGSAKPPGTLLCQIARASYARTLQARCMSRDQLDWHGFTLGAATKGGSSCSGGILYNPDTQQPTYVRLPYGHTWRRAAFTCSSRVTGVTCRSAAGHGLFISRLSWRTW